jgi:hypothetical protein
MATMTADQLLADRAAEQLLAHEADPYRTPKYLGCEDEPTSDYTVGSPEELDA